MAGGLLGSSRRGGGRSRRSARRSRLAEINVTPFVDVMLVLLIIFMVTAPLLTVSVPVELPQTEAKMGTSESDPLTVSVQADGSIYLQDTKVDPANLVPQLRAISREGYDRQIYIRGDAHADWDPIAKVLAQLSTAGFRKLQIVTDTDDHPPRRAGG
ncbi:MAG: biopolymer transporter ExbD [Pseudomonadota bacterium]